MTGRPPVAVRQAATVLVLRDSPEGPQVYFMRRPARASFAASAYVFPGGGVDAADASPETLMLAPGFDASIAASRMHLDEDVSRVAGLHVAAVREVFEETGILVGTRADGSALGEADAETLATARSLALDGVPFGDVLRQHGLRMAPERLAYVAHFITPEGEPRRYDTRFFAVEAPLEQEAAHHAAEATHSGWYTAAEALDMAGSDFTLMLPPTRIMCAEVSVHGTVAALLADLGSRPVDCILFSIDDVINGRLPTTLPATWPPPSPPPHFP
jgi:8-oxo-dGTP pyrophosphatase MutT (NUDIX family)